MIKYFAFFMPWTCPDGTHINEEQNQNLEMSTEYKPKRGAPSSAVTRQPMLDLLYIYVYRRSRPMSEMQSLCLSAGNTTRSDFIDQAYACISTYTELLEQ